MGRRAAEFIKRTYPLAALLLIAVALRLITLAAKGLWLDEAYSVILARHSLSDLIAGLSLESTPPLYYLSLHFWINIFGANEAAVRALSLVFSLGTVALLYAIGRKYFGRPAAVVAAVLAAFSPLQVYYAQETRMYSLLALLAAGLLYFTIQVAVDSSAPATGKPVALRRAAIGMGIIGLLLLYTHTVALWFVAGCFLSALYFTRNRKARAPVLLSLAGMIVAYLPWAFVLIKQLSRQATVLGWFVPFWQSKPVWRHALDSLSSLSFGPFPPYLAMRNAGNFMIAPALLALVILIWGLIAGRKSAAVKACSLAGLLAFGLPLIYSRFFQPVYIPGRTDQYLQPLFLLLVGVGALSLSRRRILPAVVALLFCALSVGVLVPYYANSEKSASRTYMEEVRQVAAPGDILIATGYTVATSQYYALKWNMPVVLLTYPLSLESHPGFFNARDEESRPETLIQDANSLAARLADPAAAGQKGIILATPHELNEVLLGTLARDFRLNDVPGGPDQYEGLLGTPVRIIQVRK